MAYGANLSPTQAHGKTPFGLAISFGPKRAEHSEAYVEHILSVFWSAELSQGPPAAAL